MVAVRGGRGGGSRWAACKIRTIELRSEVRVKTRFTDPLDGESGEKSVDAL
jgi:hypothetical protein